MVRTRRQRRGAVTAAVNPPPQNPAAQPPPQPPPQPRAPQPPPARGNRGRGGRRGRGRANPFAAGRGLMGAFQGAGNALLNTLVNIHHMSDSSDDEDLPPPLLRGLLGDEGQQSDEEEMVEYEPEPHPGNFAPPPAPPPPPLPPPQQPPPQAQAQIPGPGVSGGGSAAMNQSTDSVFGADGGGHTCPICMDTFADPKVFPCGHSVCGEDAEGLIANGTRQGNNQTKVTCPICRSVASIRRGAGLATNFALAQLIEEMRERKDGAVGSREPCTACKAPTPKDQIWFCLQCAEKEGKRKEEEAEVSESEGDGEEEGGASKAAVPIAAEEEAGEHSRRGLAALCPACLIRQHNGHRVSLFNDQVRRRQFREALNDLGEAVGALRALRPKLESDWVLLAEVVFNLATDEYAAAPARFQQLHQDLANLAARFVGEGWMTDGGPPGSTQPRSRLLYHFLRLCRSFLSKTAAMASKASSQSLGSPDPKKPKMESEGEGSPSSSDGAGSNQRRRLVGFAKLIARLYVGGVGGCRELVSATLRGVYLKEETPSKGAVEAVCDLAAIVGPTMQADKAMETGLLDQVLERLKLDALLHGDLLGAPMKAYIKATMERAKNGWKEKAETGAEAEEDAPEEKEAKAKPVSIMAQRFFERRLREKALYQDDEETTAAASPDASPTV